MQLNLNDMTEMDMEEMVEKRKGKGWGNDNKRLPLASHFGKPTKRI